jgi:uncharacterized membrane protein YphA (DoxX/SURF4 family)
LERATTNPTATVSASHYSPSIDGPPPRADATSEWSVARLIAFRFAFVYVVLYTFPGPFYALQSTSRVFAWYGSLWRPVVPWVARDILRLAHPLTGQPGGGDSLATWVQDFTMLCVAAIVALAWTALARRTRSHPGLLEALRVYLRFTLASILFLYGFDKVIPNQFEPLGPYRLTEYVGEASPGGFAWSFLGSSVAYTIFAGAGEVTAGLLLLFRRTATAGALIGAAVLMNVFMLNMSYDIPVKQFSIHLLLMCIGVAAYDGGRLLNVFIRQRAAAPPYQTELFSTPRPRRVAAALGIMLGAWLIGEHVYREVDLLHRFGRLAPRGPLYGIFEVEEFVKDGTVQPALLTDASRWRRLSSSNRGTTIRMATDTLVSYRLRTDTLKHVATFTPGQDSANKAVLAYAFPDSVHLVLRGHIGHDSVEMTLRRRPESSYLLVSRGFHWVNEVPFFR